MAEISTKKLIFVYNANAGIHNTVLDGAHKILSPKTYKCSLCDITYGTFVEKRNWKKFREKFTYKMEFLHKDEFKKQYASKFGYKFDFPVVLGTSNGNFEIFITKNELNGLANADELIRLIQSRV